MSGLFNSIVLQWAEKVVSLKGIDREKMIIRLSVVTGKRLYKALDQSDNTEARQLTHALYGSSFLNLITATLSATQDSPISGHLWIKDHEAIAKQPSMIKHIKRICANCGCTFDEAPTFCPRKPVSKDKIEQIRAGMIDFIFETWVTFEPINQEGKPCQKKAEQNPD